MTVIETSSPSSNGSSTGEEANNKKPEQNAPSNKVIKRSLIPVNKSIKLAIEKFKASQNSQKTSSSSLSTHVTLKQESNDKQKRSRTIMTLHEAIAESTDFNRDALKAQENILPNKPKNELFKLPNENSSQLDQNQEKKKFNLRSETIVLRNNNNESDAKLKQNKLLNQKKILHKKKLGNNLMFNSKTYEKIATSSSSLSSGSLSSPSSTINAIENATTLFDLIDSIKKSLHNIEKSYSLNDLFNCLISNVKTNVYRSISIKFLEQFYSKTQPKNLFGKYSNSLPSSQLQMSRPAPVRSLSQLKASPAQSDANANHSTRPMQKLFKHLNLLRSFLGIIERDLIDDILRARRSVMSNRASPVKNFLTPMSGENCHLATPRRSITNLGHAPTYHKHDAYKAFNAAKLDNNFYDDERTNESEQLRRYQEQIASLDERLSILVNDTNANDLHLLSRFSALPTKFDSFKSFEFVLRLTTDVVFKMRTLLDICQKIYQLKSKKIQKKEFGVQRQLRKGFEAAGEFDAYEEFINEEEEIIVMKNIQRKKTVNLQKLPKLVSEAKPFYNEEETTRPKVAYTKASAIEAREQNDQQMKYLKLIKQDSNDSFIRETDSSSIMSDDDSNVNFTDEPANNSPEPKATNYRLQSDANQFEFNQLNNSKNTLSDIYYIQDRDQLIEQYGLLQNQLNLSNKTLRNLNIYMDSLIQRAERCAYLKIQLKNDVEMIRNTENSLKNYADGRSTDRGQDYNKQLEKQLDFLKYKFKITLQDFNIEKVCAPEINGSIRDTEQKIQDLNSYINNLSKNMLYIETKLSKPKKQMPELHKKSNHPFTLPSINQSNSFRTNLGFYKNHDNTKDFNFYK